MTIYIIDNVLSRLNDDIQFIENKREEYLRASYLCDNRDCFIENQTKAWFLLDSLMQLMMQRANLKLLIN